MGKNFLEDENISFVKKNGLVYLQFKNLMKFSGNIKHCFTTRLGGVSSGECSSLNLGFSRKDTKENVLENYKRICSALDIDYSNIVLSDQVHDKKVRTVDEGDRGKGIIKESDIIGYDALVTNKRNITLVTFYADCVPIFFFDSAKGVIGLAHSGWKGTLKEIAKEVVQKMKNDYNSVTEDIYAAIGPSIRKCCFEVGNEVVDEFASSIRWSTNFIEKKNVEKFHINLQGIIKTTLINSGILNENICECNTCTKCNNDTFFSHRGDNGKTGSMAAIMQLI